MRVFYGALLILSGASIFLTLSNVPAFDADLRKPTIFGDWRVATNSAMYDKATYAFQRGYGFLAADALVSSETEAGDEIATIEMAEKRARAAVDALEESIDSDPGNAHAWASLAWGHARLGADEIALTSLRNSWELAPYNRVLAATRVNLVSIVTTPELANIRLSEQDIQAVKRDFSTLRRFDHETFEFYTDAAPYLKELAGIRSD
ncbi:hypothetical protein [Roseobacter sp.]|uniref:hypothetical protein n=1 Tax=Roseobacter sp. TaxID=1907202 RepID=UPI00385D2771